MMSLPGNMRKSISLFLAGIIFISTASFAKAAPFLVEGEVAVPSSCQVTDTAGVLHTFPKDSSPSGLLGICALSAANRLFFSSLLRHFKARPTSLPILAIWKRNENSFHLPLASSLCWLVIDVRNAPEFF
jgi:hypothetical protein